MKFIWESRRIGISSALKMRRSARTPVGSSPTFPTKFRGIGKWLIRYVWDVEIPGSSPGAPTNFKSEGGIHGYMHKM